LAFYVSDRFERKHSIALTAAAIAVFGYIAGAWLLTAGLTLLLGPRTTGQRLEVLNPLVAAAFAEPVPIPVSRRAI
jgi:hypothetical protein